MFAGRREQWKRVVDRIRARNEGKGWYILTPPAEEAPWCAALDAVLASAVEASSIDDIASIPRGGGGAVVVLPPHAEEPSDLPPELRVVGSETCVYRSVVRAAAVAHRVFAEHDTSSAIAADLPDVLPEDAFDRLGLLHGTTHDGVAFRPMSSATSEVACALAATRLVALGITPSLPISYAMKRMHHVVRKPGREDESHDVSISVLGEWGGGEEGESLTLGQAIATGKVTMATVHSAMIQVALAVAALAVAGGVVHNDLHLNNVLMVKTADEFDHYVLDPELTRTLERCTFSPPPSAPSSAGGGRQYYRVPLNGYRVMLIDFGRASVRRGASFRYSAEGVFSRTLDVLATPLQTLAYMFAAGYAKGGRTFEVLSNSSLWKALSEEWCTFCDAPVRNRVHRSAPAAAPSVLRHGRFGDVLEAVHASVRSARRVDTTSAAHVEVSIRGLKHLPLAVGYCAFDAPDAFSRVILRAMERQAVDVAAPPAAAFPVLLPTFENTLTSATTPLRALAAMHAAMLRTRTLAVPSDYYMRFMDVGLPGVTKVLSPPSPSSPLTDDVREDGLREWGRYYGGFYRELFAGPVSRRGVSFRIGGGRAGEGEEEVEGEGLVLHLSSGRRFVDRAATSPSPVSPLPPHPRPPPPPPPPTARNVAASFVFDSGARVEVEDEGRRGRVVYYGGEDEEGREVAALPGASFVVPIDALHCAVVGTEEGAVIDATGRVLTNVPYLKPIPSPPTFSFAIDRGSFGVAWEWSGGEKGRGTGVSLFAAATFEEFARKVYAEDADDPITHVEFATFAARERRRRGEEGEGEGDGGKRRRVIRRT